MGKSYRKPYGTCCNVKCSEHDLKTLCSRIWRRAQEQAVREAFRNDSWDELVIPARAERKLGTEYDLRRDGHKRHINRPRWVHRVNNPYAYVDSPTSYTEEEIFQRWEEHKEYHRDYIAWASRK